LRHGDGLVCVLQIAALELLVFFRSVLWHSFTGSHWKHIAVDQTATAIRERPLEAALAPSGPAIYDVASSNSHWRGWGREVLAASAVQNTILGSDGRGIPACISLTRYRDLLDLEDERVAMVRR
jgi:hypothetical protein